MRARTFPIDASSKAEHRAIYIGLGLIFVGAMIRSIEQRKRMAMLGLNFSLRG
jgi:hypothetical protein